MSAEQELPEQEDRNGGSGEASICWATNVWIGKSMGPSGGELLFKQSLIRSK